jgi:hypothetical protein
MAWLPTTEVKRIGKEAFIKTTPLSFRSKLYRDPRKMSIKVWVVTTLAADLVPIDSDQPSK